MKESFINKFIANYIIMERNDSYSSFHPVILMDTISRLNGENNFKQELINILKERGIKIIESESFLEREYYSYDSYKLLNEKEPIKFDDRQVQYLFILMGGKQKEIARNKLVLYNLRLAIYSSWKIVKENNLDISFIDSYSYEALSNAIDNFKNISLSNFNVYAINFINREVKKVIKQNSLLTDLYSRNKNEDEYRNLCYDQKFYDEVGFTLEDVLNILDFRKKKVIKGIMGLGEEKIPTLKQLASDFGVSIDLIVRLKNKALKELELHMNNAGYNFTSSLEQFTNKPKIYEIINNKRRF